jgi:exodeoxyribonuclease-3
MRILSWNVNGIRAAKDKGLLEFLSSGDARLRSDLVCIQETKAEPGQLPPELIAPLDAKGKSYRSYWASAKKRGYSGCAIYCKAEPDDVRQLGIAKFDDEGRWLEADFGAVTVVSAYFPNSQEAGKRLPYKLSFCRAALARCKKIVEAGRHVVLCGDYNIAHKPQDLAHPKENEGNAGYLPEERAWLDKFTRAGYVDTFRRFYPDKPQQYSWWSYRMKARERNVGWRIDYACVDAGFADAVKDAFILPDVYGSDHCPVGVALSL